jgi:hypothetical protein
MKNKFGKFISLFLAAFFMISLLSGMVPDYQTINASSNLFDDNESVIVEGQAAIDILLNSGTVSEVRASDIEALLRAAVTTEFESRGITGNAIPAIRTSLPKAEVADASDLKDWVLYSRFDPASAGNLNGAANWTQAFANPHNNKPGALDNITALGGNWHYTASTDRQGDIRGPIISSAAQLDAFIDTRTGQINSARNGQAPMMYISDWVNRTHSRYYPDPVPSGNHAGCISVNCGRPGTDGRTTDNGGRNTLWQEDSLGAFESHILSHQIDGKTYIDFVGYSVSAFQDFVYYICKSAEPKTVTFEVHTENVNPHTLDGFGFLINTGTENLLDGSGTIDGYLLYFGYVKNNNFDPTPEPGRVALYRLQGTSGQTYTAAALHTFGTTFGSGGRNNSFTQSTAGRNRFQLIAGSESRGTGSTDASEMNVDRNIWRDAGGKMELGLSITPTSVRVYQKPLGSGEEWEMILNATGLEDTGYHGFGPYVGYNSHNCPLATQFTFADIKMTYVPQSDDIYDVLTNASFIQNADQFFVDFTDNGANRNLTDSQGGDAAAFMQATNIAYLTNNPNRCGSSPCGTGTGCAGCDRRPATTDGSGGNCCYEWNTSENRWDLVCVNIVCANAPYSANLPLRDSTPQLTYNQQLANEIAKQIVDEFLKREAVRNPAPDTKAPYIPEPARHIKGLNQPVARLTLVGDIQNPGTFIEEVRRDFIGAGGLDIFAYDAASQPSDGADLNGFYYRIINPKGIIIGRDGLPTATSDTNGFIHHNTAFTTSNQATSLLRITNDASVWIAGEYEVYLMVRDNSGKYSSNRAVGIFEIVEDTNAPLVPEVHVDFVTKTLSFTAKDIPTSEIVNFGVDRFELVTTPVGGGAAAAVTIPASSLQTAASRTPAGAEFSGITIPDGILNGEFTWVLRVIDLAGNITTVPLPSIDFENERLFGLPPNQSGISGTGIASPPAAADSSGRVSIEIDDTNPVSVDYRTADTDIIITIPPKPFEVTVNVYADGYRWNDAPDYIPDNFPFVITLKPAAGNEINADSDGKFKNLTAGVYEVYVDGISTNVSFTLTAGQTPPEVRLEYLTLRLIAGYGTENPVQTSAAPPLLGGEGVLYQNANESVGIYFAGTSVTVDVTVPGGFVWDEWDSDHNYGVPNFPHIPARTHTFNMPAHPLELTARAHGNGVAVNVMRNGSYWNNHSLPLRLVSTADPTEVYSSYDVETPYLNVALFYAVPIGTYRIYDGDTDTGVTVTVTGGAVTGGSATLHYYVLTLIAAEGTSNAAGGGTFFAGANVSISVAVNEGFHWKKWESNNIYFSDVSMQNTAITMPAHALTLTATAETAARGGGGGGGSRNPIPPTLPNEQTPEPEPLPAPEPVPEPTPEPAPERVSSNIHIETDPDITLNTEKQKVFDIVFTKEELERIEKGEDAKVFLLIEDVSGTLSESEKALISEQLAALELDGHTVGMYIDISMLKQIGDDDPKRLLNLDQTISLSIEIPQHLRVPGRTFKIVNVRGGVTEIIEGIYDHTTGLFTFSASELPLGVLLFSDGAAATDFDSDRNPITGVTAGFAAGLSASGISIAITARKRK